MPVTELRCVRHVAHVAALVSSLALTCAPSTEAQPLPRVEGPLTMEQAVELARDKSLRVKASDADSRTMDSMRREDGPERIHVGGQYHGAELSGVQRQSEP